MLKSKSPKYFLSGIPFADIKRKLKLKWLLSGIAFYSLLQPEAQQRFKTKVSLKQKTPLFQELFLLLGMEPKGAEPALDPPFSFKARQS